MTLTLNSLAASDAVVSWDHRPFRVKVGTEAKVGFRYHNRGDLEDLLGLWAKLATVAETVEEKRAAGRELLKIEEVWEHCAEAEPWAELGNYALSSIYSTGWPPPGYD